VLGHRPRGAGDTESRRHIWDFIHTIQARGHQASSPPAPAFEHDVKVTATGLRHKLEVFEQNLRHLSQVEATEHLKHTVTSALNRSKFHQFYYEEVECCLKLRADPMQTSQNQSILACVLRNANLNESIAVQSVTLLTNAIGKAGHKLNRDELTLLRKKVNDAKSPAFKKRWSQLVRARRGTSP